MTLWQGPGQSINTTNLEFLKQQLDKIEASSDFIAEPKEDGHYTTAFCGQYSNRFFSRNRRPQNSPELEKIQMPPGLIIAGELGVGTEAALRLKKILGHEYAVVHRLLQTPDFLLGKYPRDATQLNEVEQRKVLEEIWSTLPINIQVRFQLIPRTNKMFWPLYRKTLENGGEGIILKKTSSIQEGYTPGAYSQSWIKIKKTTTVDMVLIEIFDSSSKTFQNSFLAGAILCGMYDSKGVLHPLTRIGTMDHSTRHHLFVNKHCCIGKVVELGCYEQFSSGALRHPWFIRFREDKNPEECVFEKIEMMIFLILTCLINWKGVVL